MSKTPITPVYKRFSLGSIAFAAIMFPLLLTACGGGKDNGDGSGSGGGTTEFTVNTTAGSVGSIDPSSATVASGDTTSFTVTPDSGYAIDTVTGCGGSLSGNTYTTGAITADCTVSASFALLPPASAAVPTLSFTQVKLFRFSWTDVADATFYRLLENPDGVSGFSPVGADIPAGTEQYDHEVPLYARVNARYILQSCNAAGCTDSSEASVSDNLAAAVGYFKASNTGADDRFGYSVALSGDGNTLAVGAYLEDSNATGIDGAQADNTANDAGAVYVFTRDAAGSWSQQAYIKASNTDAKDFFGYSVALSANGNTLAVGAVLEDSDATAINGDQAGGADNAGAVYVFTRTAGSWNQQAYVKPFNTDAYDNFGHSVALSADGNTLAVGAPQESSNATGIGNGQNDNSVGWSGAVYVFTRSGTTWNQQAYVKASNTGFNDYFGDALALSADGNTLAVGALLEDGDFDMVADSGAVYVFIRSGTSWEQQAYIKASNAGAEDYFGSAVALSADGDTLAVGADRESGISDSLPDAGAVYVFTRTGTSWNQQDYLKASNTTNYMYFGSSVSLSADGNRLAIGAIGDYGAAYVFTRDSVNWTELIRLEAPSRGYNDRFGNALALSADGNTLAVGAHQENSAATGINGDQTDNSADNAGAVYLY